MRHLNLRWCILVITSLAVVSWWSSLRGQQQNAEQGEGRKMVAAAQDVPEALREHYKAETIEPSEVYIWSRRLMEAQLKTESDRNRRVAAAEAHLARMVELHKRIDALFRGGGEGGEAASFHATEYYVAEARLEAESLRAARP